MNLEKLHTLVGDVSYKDWTIRTGKMGDGWFVQLRFYAPDACSLNGDVSLQCCRKWYISPHMTDSEVVQTVFLAIKTAETHELLENFKFKGVQIFCPHLDLNEFTSVVSGVSHDARQHLYLSE